MLTDDQLAEITRRATRDKWDCDMDTLLQEVRALRAERDRDKAALEDIRVHALRWKERKESQAAEWDYLSGSPFASQLEVVYALLTVLKKHGWVAQEVERAYRGEEQGAVGQ